MIKEIYWYTIFEHKDWTLNLYDKQTWEYLSITQEAADSIFEAIRDSKTKYMVKKLARGEITAGEFKEFNK